MAVLFALTVLCPSSAPARELQPTQPTVVRKVRFTTTGRMSTERLEGIVSAYFERETLIRPGWEEDLVRRAREACAQQGYLRPSIRSEVVRGESQSETQQVDVTIRIDEGDRYRLKRIEWSGVKAFTLELLRGYILLSDGDVYDSSAIESGTGGINQLYHSKGYLNADTSTELEFNDADLSVVLRISVDEGEYSLHAKRPSPPGSPVIVRRVTFSNVKDVSLAKLRGIAIGYYEGQTFWGDGWARELAENLRDFFQHQGYFKPEIQSKVAVVEETDTSKIVAADYWIDEGPRYTLKGIEFYGMHEHDPSANPALNRAHRSTGLVFSPDELRAAMPIADGEIFDALKIRFGLENVQRMYLSRGYINGIPIPETVVDEATHQITLRADIDEGKQFHIGKVKLAFTGSAAREGEALKQNWPFKAGDVYDNTLITTFFDENKHVLPPSANPDTDCEWRIHQDTATVDVQCTFGDEH